MTTDELYSEGNILLECISGSRAYGTDTPESDTDIRGIFIASPEQFYGLTHPTQINDDTNDIDLLRDWPIHGTPRDEQSQHRRTDFHTG